MSDPTMGDYEVAEAVAPTWAQRAPMIEQVCTPVRQWLVRELHPSEGDTVLELAAGVGDTGFDVAELLGERGGLIASDFSPTMLEAARQRGAERGIENVEYRVIDAARIELPDNSVDGVLCRFGYMLMPELTAALAETRRVLRPGGRVALAVWGAPERNPFFALVGAKLVERGHMPPPEPPPAPGIFSMASPERTRELLTAAGFDDVRTEEVALRFPIPSVEEYVAFVADTAGPLALVLRELPAAERAALQAELEEAFEPFSADSGFELPGVTLCAVAS